MPIFTPSPGWTVTLAGVRKGHGDRSTRVEKAESRPSGAALLRFIPCRSSLPAMRDADLPPPLRNLHARTAILPCHGRSPSHAIRRNTNKHEKASIELRCSRPRARFDVRSTRAAPFGDPAKGAPPPDHIRRAPIRMTKARPNHYEKAESKEESSAASALCSASKVTRTPSRSTLQSSTWISDNGINPNRSRFLARPFDTDSIGPKKDVQSFGTPRGRRERSANPSQVELGCKSQNEGKPPQSLPELCR